MKLLWSLLMQLDWHSAIIVTDNDTEMVLATRPATHVHHQNVVVQGNEALSGDWVGGVIRTGEDSWAPLRILLICSLTCVHAALQQASIIARTVGTQSAFPMTARWMLVITGNDAVWQHLDVNNVSMDNVVAVDLRQSQRLSDGKCHRKCGVAARTLLWTSQGRQWSVVSRAAVTSCRTSGTHGKSGAVARCTEDVLFPNTKHGYNGRHLRVIAKEWLSYVQSEGNAKGGKSWSGLLLDVLLLASQQLNFTYDLLEPEDGQWGTGTVTDPSLGLYGQVINRNVDIGLAPTDVIYDRALLMDFSYPVVFSPFVMVYKTPSTDPGMWMLLSPLETQLLLAVGGALVAVTFLVCVMERNDVRSRPGREGSVAVGRVDELLMNVAEMTTGAVLMKPTERQLQSDPGRVLLYSWRTMSLVVAAAYSGTLTAYLSVTRHQQLFTSAADLVTRQHDYSWGTVGGTALTVVLQGSNDTTLQRLWQGMQDFAATDSDVMSSDVDTLASKVSRGNFVMLQTERFAQYLFGHLCDVHIVDAAIKQGMTALVLPKGSALTRPLSTLIQRLHSHGEMSRLTERWFPLASCPPPPSGPLTISLQHVQGVLLLLPLGLALALVGLGLEILQGRGFRWGWYH